MYLLPFLLESHYVFGELLNIITRILFVNVDIRLFNIIIYLYIIKVIIIFLQIYTNELQKFSTLSFYFCFSNLIQNEIGSVIKIRECTRFRQFDTNVCSKLFLV